MELIHLTQLKETAELRIMEIIRALQKMQDLYGIDKLKDSIEILQEIRSDLFVDLETINQE